MADWLTSGAASNPPLLRHRLILHQSELSPISSFDLHPSKPLFATAHEDHKLRVWSYDVNTSSCCGSNLQCEFDFHPSTSPFIVDDLVSPSATRSSKKGSVIRGVRFFDGQVVASKQSLQPYPQAPPGKAIHRLAYGSWILVLTDSSTLFLNYWTHCVEEIPHDQLNGKPVYAADFCPYAPLVALGGPDGQIRVWDLVTWSTAYTLHGGHSKGPIVSLHLYEKGDTIRLISAGEDGKLCYWKWSSTERHGSKIKLGKDHSIRAHDKIEMMVYDYVRQCCVTTGADRVTKAWPLDHSKAGDAIYSVKPPAKSAWTFAYPVNHPGFLCDTLVVAGKDDSTIHITGSAGQGLRDVVDACDLVGGSKKTKIAVLGVHPTHPSIMLMASRNTEKTFDLYILQFEPLSHPDFALVGQAQDNLQLHFMNESDKVFSLAVGDGLAAHSAEKAFTLARKGGKALICASPTQKYLSVFSGNKHRYDVYQREDGFKKLFSGKATRSFAWLQDPRISPEDETATLSNRKKSPTEIFITVEVIEEQSVGDKKKSKKASATPEPISKLYRNSIKSGKVTKEEIVLGDDFQATNVWEGAAILVGLWRGGTEGEGESSSKPSKDASHEAENAYTRLPTHVRFLDVKHGCVGPELPVPYHVYWSSSGEFCALAYATRLDVCAARPTFRLLFSLPVSCNSALFFQKTLFFSTSNEISMVCALGHAPHVVCIARSGADSDASAAGTSSVSLPLPLPIGPLSLVCVQETMLVVLDVAYRSHMLSLDHPLIKFHVLAGMERHDEALACAEALPHSMHSSLARVLKGLDASRAAIKLSGISTIYRMELCLEENMLSEGMECLTQMVDNIESIATDRSRVITLGRALVDADDTPNGEVKQKAMRAIATLDPSEYTALLLHLAKINETDKILSLVNEGVLPPHEATLALLLSNPTAMDESIVDAHPEMILHQCHLLGKESSKAQLDAWSALMQQRYPSLPAVEFHPPEE